MVLGLLLLLGGCDDGDLLPPDPAAGDRFARYVAIGNSITAGFQSDGINAATQEESYAVLLARQMGHDIGETFNIPAFEPPGCPPPLTNVFTGERLGNDVCALREPSVPATIHNVAVPGAAVADVLTNAGEQGANPNSLTTFILGGRTQMEAAEEAQPTFVSVWIGNNDVLSAALSGTPDVATPADSFASRYEELLGRLDPMDLQGGALIGVSDVTLIPYLSPGVAYFEAEQAGALPEAFDVADNCAPDEDGGVGESTLVPFEYGFGAFLVLAQQGTDVTLDCEDNRPLGEIFEDEIPSSLAVVSILTADEIQTLQARIAAYNEVIEQAASEQGFAYLDPNELFSRPDIREQIPLFPNVTDPDAPFGPLFSQDGVHPSAEGHEHLADAFIEAINDAYDAGIPSLSGAE